MKPRLREVPCVLAIAGSDSGGGAGIQADLKACEALGVFGTTAVTALTAQNTVGVQAVHAVPASFVGDQMASVLGDFRVHALKTGMLPTAETIREVARRVGALRAAGGARGGGGRAPALVLDPVMVASSGDALIDAGAEAALRDELLLATLATPNLPEAARLLGWELASLDGRARMAEAARRDPRARRAVRARQGRPPRGDRRRGRARRRRLL